MASRSRTSELSVAGACLGSAAAALIVLWEIYISIGHVIGGLLVPASPPDGSSDFSEDLGETAVVVLPHLLIAVLVALAVVGLWKLAARRRGAATVFVASALWTVVAYWMATRLVSG